MRRLNGLPVRGRGSRGRYWAAPLVGESLAAAWQPGTVRQHYRQPVRPVRRGQYWTAPLVGESLAVQWQPGTVRQHYRQPARPLPRGRYWMYFPLPPPPVFTPFILRPAYRQPARPVRRGQSWSPFMVGHGPVPPPPSGGGGELSPTFGRRLWRSNHLGIRRNYDQSAAMAVFIKAQL